MIYITGDTHIPIDISKLNTRNFPEQKKLTKKIITVIYSLLYTSNLSLHLIIV